MIDIGEKKKEIVINNYFSTDCNFDTSIKDAYIKGFNRGIEKAEMVYCKKLKALDKQFRLMGNCLHARNKYAEDGWVFVKELENEEEHNAWKEILLCQ